MITDAAGGAGTKNQPRFITQEKNEPQRNKMLKSKWTFCVVHGVGTLIYSSYPTLGGQGANLTLEVIFRGKLLHTFRRMSSTCFRTPSSR
jgi:hypothetical protein